MSRKNSGFTLIELIIVIAIMVTLVAIIVPSILKYNDKAKKAADLQNAKAIASALEYASVEGRLEIRQNDVVIAVFVDKDSLIASSFKGATFTPNQRFQNIEIDGNTADNGKVVNLLMDNGITDVTCHQKDIKWYAVTFSGDGMSTYWEGRGRKNLRNGVQVGWDR